MQSGALTLARKEAMVKLEEVEAEFSRLDQQRKQLQSIVDAITSYLDVGDVSQKYDPPSFADAPTDGVLQDQSPQMQQPAWMSARDVLVERGVAMNVPQIYARLQEKGISIARDAIRIAMIRRSDMFVNKQVGFYALTAWDSDSDLTSKEYVRTLPLSGTEREVTEVTPNSTF